MDAQLVWNTWRRVLTDDRLVNWVLDSDSRTGDPHGCSADEVAILADYAATPVPTKANIGMYRRGLVRNALGSLDLVPLTRRLLHTSGLDIEAVATEFVQSNGYVDNGPYFWRAAGCFVAYLRERPEFSSQAHQDVLAIDAETVALARRLGEAAPTMWPNNAVTPFSAAATSRIDWETGRFFANPAATVVSSSCDLTPWIERPFDFDGDEDVEFSPRHWLIYAPAAEAAHEYAELSERTALAFKALQTPKSVTELSLELGNLPREEVLSVIGSLAELGVVVSESNLANSAIQGPRSHPENGLQPADKLYVVSQQTGGATSHGTA